MSGLLPALLTTRLERDRGAPPTTWSIRFRAALLVADLTGFTALAERLAEAGPSGVERLSHVLNSCFGRLADEIAARGGDIVRFAGDAPIAVFRADADDSAALCDAVSRAHLTGEALQLAMPELSIATGQPLTLRVGVAAGDVVARSVGGVAGRWEVLVGGPPFAAVAAALARAKPGDVVVVAGPGDGCTATPTITGASAPARARAAVAGRADGSGSIETLMAAARAYVPRSVIARLDAGHDDWMAELRRVTVLFVFMRGLDHLAPDSDRRLSDVAMAIQESVYDADGSVNQLLVDDKGTTLVAAWGIPGRGHDDDPIRATGAAEAIHKRLTALGVPHGIGLATGRAFCGWRGNETRREFALIGSTVNLAARLAGASPGPVLVDRATRDGAARRIDFRDHGAVALKGNAAFVGAFTPTAPSRETAVRPPTESHPRKAVVGRNPERTALRALLDSVQAGHAGAIFIEGDPGLGKSTLLASLVEDAAAQSVRVAAASAHPLARRGALETWQTLLRQLMAFPESDSSDVLRAAFDRWRATAPDAGERTPLAAALFGIDLPETPLTAAMTPGLRAEALRDSLVQLLTRESAPRPTCLVIDDAQWLDSISWSALAAVIRRVPSLGVVTGMRPMAERPTEWGEMLGSSRVAHLHLERLSDEETLELARNELGVALVPDQLRALILTKTSGQPLFVGELVRWLRDIGAIAIEDGRCRIATDLGDLPQELPSTVEGAVVGRLDQMAPGHQLTLRVASVVGPSFSVRSLSEIHPISLSEASLQAELDDCARLGFITVASIEGEATYAFRHAIVQDVAYGLLPAMQRIGLHRAVAEWHERAAGEGRPVAILAHHWTRAEDYSRAVDYLAQAGDGAVAQGATRETIRFFGRAAELASQHALAVDPLRQARWHRHMGRAMTQIGQADRAPAEFSRALALVDYSFPDASGAVRWRFAREAARQLWHVVKPNRRAGSGRREWSAALSGPRHAGADRDRAAETIHILTHMGDQAFYNADHLRYFTTSLSAMNCAESAGLVHVASNGYASCAYLASLLKVEPLARRWWRLGGDPPDAEARLALLMSRSMSLVQQARWDDVQPILTEHNDLARRVGASVSIDAGLVAQLIMEFHSGRLDDSLSSARALLASALAQANELHELWARMAICVFLMHTGDVAGAQEESRRVDVLGEVPRDELSRAQFLANRIHMAIAGDNLDGAVPMAAALEALVRRTRPNSVGTLGPFEELARFFLSVWARAAERGDALGEVPAHARWAVRELGRFAFFFPFARPIHALARAKRLWLTGQSGRARAAWRRTMALAERYQTPAQEAEAAELLGRRGGHPPDHQETRALLDRAARLYQRIGYRAASASLEQWRGDSCR